KEQVDRAKQVNDIKTKTAPAVTGADSASVAALESSFGSFAYSATLPAAKGGQTVLENDLVKLVVSNKGGQIVKAEAKEFTRFHKDSGELVKLIDQNNAAFNLSFQTTDGRSFETKNLFFEPTDRKSTRLNSS